MEAIDILLAGSDTTAFTLATSLFYILRDEKVKVKLIETLDEHMPDPDNMLLLKLEKIEYLWACVKESLRIAMPVPGQLPRVVPKGKSPLAVNGQVVPPGTVTGMSAYTMNFDPELWGPDSRFIAHAEVTILLAYLFRDFEMTLHTHRLDPTGLFVSTYKHGVYVKFKHGRS
ncbi:hypothetical protein DL762_007683 [Monosporascus cannonballus]|uniref:Cytochrome P450 n=1 Tax=Monosporascus cannonballus TaxID=155416 RepID=A0ABY0H2V2_9PEZI|nr:hypothetical protein DL762_007683 [Monosporascus cannonballus]